MDLCKIISSVSTHESIGSDLRRPDSDKGTPEKSSSSSRRRRVPNVVNACLNCKKARTKCDGNKPCKRCTTRLDISECMYDVHIKDTKAELVKQIKELRAKNQVTERILEALSNDEKESRILERLKTGDTYDSIVEWLGHSSGVDSETLSSRTSHQRTQPLKQTSVFGIF